MKNFPVRSPSSALSPATSGFVLAAAITALFNTGLACAKDAYPPLNDVMKLAGGHHWATHGIVDLVMFVGLGVIFTKTKAAEQIDPNRLNVGFVAALSIASLGLVLWYLLV